MAYYCENLDELTGDCSQWVETIALPVLTMQDVFALGSATLTLFAVAFGCGVLVKMLLTAYASRH